MTKQAKMTKQAGTLNRTINNLAAKAHCVASVTSGLLIAHHWGCATTIVNRITLRFAHHWGATTPATPAAATGGEDQRPERHAIGRQA